MIYNFWTLCSFLIFGPIYQKQSLLGTTWSSIETPILYTLVLILNSTNLKLLDIQLLIFSMMHVIKDKHKFFGNFQVNILSKLRHPNLVTLIGACPEAWALVYEYLPNGSLEDRLNCKNNTSPLSWQTRIRIAAELCSILICLHSCRPRGIVHGDLKPANILLDSDLVSKLSDFGICRFLSEDEYTVNDTTLCWRTQPKGTLIYMDPEFLSTGELTSKSDVYSFGIILLRLLTGRPALGIAKEVQYALDKGNLKNLLDATAGDWPYVQAKQLAHLAMRCCEIEHRRGLILLQRSGGFLNPWEFPVEPHLSSWVPKSIARFRPILSVQSFRLVKCLSCFLEIFVPCCILDSTVLDRINVVKEVKIFVHWCLVLCIEHVLVQNFNASLFIRLPYLYNFNKHYLVGNYARSCGCCWWVYLRGTSHQRVAR